MSNAKGGDDDDSHRKHSGAVARSLARSGLAMPTPTLLSRHVPARVFMAATASPRPTGVGLEGRKEALALPVQREIFGRISPLPKNLIFPFRFQQKCRAARCATVTLLFPSTPRRTGRSYKRRGSGEFKLAGNHSGSSVLSVGGPARASGQIPSYQTLDRV